MNLGTLIAVFALLLVPQVEPPTILELDLGVEVTRQGIEIYVDPTFLLWSPDSEMRQNGRATFSIIVLNDRLRRPGFEDWRDYVLLEETIHVTQFRALGFAAWLLRPFMEPPFGFVYDPRKPRELERAMWTPPEWFPSLYHFLSLKIPILWPALRWRSETH